VGSLRLRQLESDYVGYVGMGDENQAAFQQTLDTIRAELEFDDAQLEERFGASQQERRETEIQNLANELTTLKDSGALSDDAIANLEANFETAADAVLSENPGMLELSRMAVESQFEVGEKLKKAAAENEFRTISELAPDLVDLYRQVDPASTSLADLASKRAEQLASGTPSTAQTGLAELAESIGARAPGWASWRASANWSC
jgi:predicted  nucleic acid-binding Zn-ribbon protein